ISNTEYIKYQGQYPVIFVTFKDLKEDTWEECLKSVKSLISDLYDKYSFIRKNLDDRNKKKFDKIFYEEDGNYEKGLLDISKYLYRYYGKRVILLIDEYDTPLINAYEKGFYDKAISFFSTLYSSVLKTNDYLQTGVLTGILKVVKEGIFSGLNNIEVYTVLDEHYSSFFGFTEKEVEKTVKEYGLADEIAKVKKWYDGYKFGNSEIYNPWSILKYLKRGKTESYWINTASDLTILRLLKQANDSMFEGLLNIFNGENSVQQIDVSSEMNNMQDSQEIWRLMLFSGYLTVDKKIDEKTYSLKLPNYEVKSFFKEKFLDYNYKENKGLFKKMINALLLKDITKYEEILRKILLNSMSYHDGAKEEKFYHNLILGMLLYLDDKYSIKSNIEEGYGRTDVLMFPLNKKVNPGFIFEFKVSEKGDDESMEKAVNEALNQIKDKEYEVEMQQHKVRDILNLGIAFNGKKVKVKLG
ncbi:MAG: AAA family ATPase, partial [Leptotrichia hongkongensis]